MDLDYFASQVQIYQKSKEKSPRILTYKLPIRKN